MSVGPFQILIIALVILVLFGRGRISDMMGDFGKGIKSFRQGIGEAEQLPADAQTATIEPQPVDKHT
jgi:sec-independent protein translocase protein TatA